METPTWAWMEEENLVNSHVNDRARILTRAIETPRPAPQAAERAAAPAVSPPARAPRFGSGGRDAADAIDVDDEPRGTPVAAPDFVAQLERLKALRDDGALDEEEFAKAKQKLLDE